MAGARVKKRVEIEERCRRVAEIYLRKVDQAEIGAETGVDPATVSRDIATIKQR